MAEQIDEYRSFIGQLDEEEQRAFYSFPATALKPLITEQDEEVKQKTITKLSKDAICKQHAGRGHDIKEEEKRRNHGTTHE